MPNRSSQSHPDDSYKLALKKINECYFDRSREVNLAAIGLHTVPPEIGKLTHITALYLDENHITDLPHEISHLRNLERLDISSNSFETIPNSIFALEKLTWFNLWGNKITQIPNDVKLLKNLRALGLESNALVDFPTAICDLKMLSELHLSGNKISSIPSEIKNLTNLAILYANENKISVLPEEVFKLTNLNYLNFSENLIETLPSQIKNLKFLKILNLTSNNISRLPSELSLLGNLELLLLHNNPKIEIPDSVLGPSLQEIQSTNEPSARPEDILDYYFSRKSQGERPLNEVKLLLVGRGESGKTSISRALRGEKFEINQRETPGIDIQPWELPCNGDDPIKVYLWDFAGQEITHETHRFFLTERSLYVVVLDGRGGQQMEEAEYWLSHAEKFGTRREGDRIERSSVIVVLNKWQSPNPYDIEKRRLQREYPNIKYFIETDCNTGFGIGELKEAIVEVLRQMPAVRQPWPITYFQVRESLAQIVSDPDPAKRRHFLSWDGYRNICKECGVSDQKRQESLAENLNALGLALYYGEHDRLRDTRVLNPNWAANGLYGLLRGVQRRPFQGKQGYFWAGEFAMVLKEGMEGMNKARGATIEDYPAQRDNIKVHQFLIDLMLDRELGFVAGEHKRHLLYMMPGLLAIDEPEVDDFDISNHIEQSKVKFRYVYDLLPAGVISRFIVRTHPLSENSFRWQRGTVLEWGEAKGLVIAERRRNPRVDIFIAGGTHSERQELAGVIRSNMEEIHKSLPDGLRGREELDLDIPGEQYESISKLERLEEQNLPVQVVTQTGAQDLPVTPQLEQIQPEKARRKGAPKLKIFVSYAHANYKVWDRLKTHLDILKNDGLVSWWFDGKIRPGSEWDNAIRKEIKEADIIVLLLSNDFFASKYIKGVEMTEALKRKRSGDAEVIPVLLEPSHAFESKRWLRGLQTVPVVNGQLRPLTSFNPNVNGWNIVQKALRDMISELASRKK